MGSWRAAGSAPQLAQRAVVRQRVQRSSGIVRASWGAPVEWATAKVVANRQVADKLHVIQLDLGEERGAGYSKAGQFVQAKIGEECKPGFFAIASAPDPNNAGVVELLIKANGEAAEAICAAAPGAEVDASPVMGKGFPVDRIPAADVDRVLLFATGSGISPLRALIQSGALEADKRKGGVKLYYGTRAASSTAFADTIPAWKEAGIEVVHVYSEDGKGYVQDVFMADGPLPNGARTGIVLVGQKQMVEAVTEFAIGQGVDKERILLNF